MDIQQHFGSLARRTDGVAIYFAGRVFGWADVGKLALELEKCLRNANLPPNSTVAWIARNEPHCIAAAIAVLATGHRLSPVNGLAPLGRRAADVQTLSAAAIIGSPEDFPPEILEVVGSLNSLALAATMDGPVAILNHYASCYAQTVAGAEPILMERMSSGTTGEPKRVPVPESAMREALVSSLGARWPGDWARSGSPAILALPFAHAAGIWALIRTLFEGRTAVLLDRFRVNQWVEAVSQHRIKVTQIVPSMIEMLLESDTPREQLASLICIRTGTAPLNPDTKRRFEARFGMPILQDYGASEFTGGVATWSMEDYRRWGADKATSVGKLRADVEVRIVDGETSEDLPNGTMGTLMLKSDRFGGEWTRTTDLASVDDDRFLYIYGRSDEAIIRGGFKILPEKVAEVIRQHRNVRDAIVMGVRDQRLGQCPIAVVELTEPDDADISGIEAFLRDRLPPYEVPVSIEVVDRLPRTISLKVDRPATKAMFAQRYDFA